MWILFNYSFETSFHLFHHSFQSEVFSCKNKLFRALEACFWYLEKMKLYSSQKIFLRSDSNQNVSASVWGGQQQGQAGRKKASQEFEINMREWEKHACHESVSRKMIRASRRTRILLCVLTACHLTTSLLCVITTCRLDVSLLCVLTACLLDESLTSLCLASAICVCVCVCISDQILFECYNTVMQ